jgi:hypothetical protein
MYLIKLANGDDIVGELKDKQTSKDDWTTVINPMKMATHPALTDRGIVETLSLNSWLYPYSEDSEIKIRKSSIVTIAIASPGMKTFYKKQLENHKKDPFGPNGLRKGSKEWEVRESKPRMRLPQMKRHKEHNKWLRSEYEEFMETLEDMEQFGPIDKKKLH